MASAALKLETEQDHRYAYEGALIDCEMLSADIHALLECVKDVHSGKRTLADLIALQQQIEQESTYKVYLKQA